MPFDFNMMQRQQRGYHLGHKNITGLNHWKTGDPKFSTSHVNHVFTFRGAFLCWSLVWNTLGVPWNAIDKAFSKGAMQDTSLCQGRTSDERAEVLKGEEHGKWKELFFPLFFFNIQDFSGFCKKAMGFGFAYSVSKFHPWKNWLCWSAILNEASTFWEVSQLIWNTPTLHTVHHQTLFQRLSTEFER